MVNTTLKQALQQINNCPKPVFTEQNCDLQTFIQDLFNTLEDKLDQDRFSHQQHRVTISSPADGTTSIIDRIDTNSIDNTNDDDILESVEELELIEDIILELFTQQGIAITKNPEGYTRGNYDNNDGCYITYIRSDLSILIIRTWYSA